ncbi:hypothetical protein [Bradyrhizobium cenepequi]
MAQSLAHKPKQRGDWREAVKLQVMLARSLRLTVQSRIDPKTLTRRMPESIDGPLPWQGYETEDAT